MAQTERQPDVAGGSDEAVDHLVAGLRASNPQAHAELYEQFGLAIQEFAARRLGETELAEDVMVQTLV
ncbi:MAG: hypothetical protein ABSD48_15560, partial [Armatimonadota bacterium]